MPKTRTPVRRKNAPIKQVATADGKKYARTRPMRSYTMSVETIRALDQYWKQQTDHSRSEIVDLAVASFVQRKLRKLDRDKKSPRRKRARCA